MFVRSLDLHARRFEDKAATAMAEAADARTVMRVPLTASATRLGGGEAPPGCLRYDSTFEIGSMDADFGAALADVNAQYLGAMTGVLRRGADEGTVPEARFDACSTVFAETVTRARAEATREALLEAVWVTLSV